MFSDPFFHKGEQARTSPGSRSPGLLLLCSVQSDPPKFAPLIVEWDEDGAIIDDFLVSPIQHFGDFSFIWVRRDYSGTANTIDRIALISPDAASPPRAYPLFAEKDPLDTLIRQKYHFKAMNHPSLLFIALCLLSPGIPLSAAEPTILIDTDFSNQTPGGEVIAEKDQDVPLKFPSIVSVRSATSSIKIAREAVGALKPPFAMFQLGGQEAKPEIVEDANLRWDLSQEGLSEGSFEITAAITPLDWEVWGGRLLVSLKGATTSDERLHPGSQPVQFSFRGKGFYVGGKIFPFNAEETYEIKMNFNLSRREWSCSINGEEILPTTPFPPQMSTENAPELLLRVVTFGSWAGMSDRPGARYALSRLTLKKVSDE